MKVGFFCTFLGISVVVRTFVLSKSLRLPDPGCGIWGAIISSAAKATLQNTHAAWTAYNSLAADPLVTGRM